MEQRHISRDFEDADLSKVWFLVQAKPNMVPRAKLNLERQGFRTFVPQIRSTKRRDDKFEQRKGPLFPGYIFVQLDPDTCPWRKINSTFGVAKLVSFTRDRPAKVPRELITDLRSRFSPEFDVAAEMHLQEGEAVHVTRGPFAGLLARVEQVAANDRIWVLLDFMGRETRVQTEKRNVLRA